MSDQSRPHSGSDRTPNQRLGKRLGLIDIYAISTGAMFSSGFFLLPGLAAAEAGPSVFLAYLAAGVMVIPAMLSAAELTTAMPRAGGPYYFLDRAMGPMLGTVAGLGTWFALVFKSAFALVGMSAYLALFVELPIELVAVVLTALFTSLNLVGAKKTSGLQVALVVLLVGVLVLFLSFGAGYLLTDAGGAGLSRQFDPLMPFGIEGLVATIGLVFVSYAGLTQVASVAEETRNPGRNLPLGMLLSLLTATALYVIGVALMVAVLEPGAFRGDLTPVATASQVFMPQPIGVALILAAALAAFASTANAGIMSAARYPLAMARDRLLWGGFARVSRFGTPVSAVLVTGFVMLLFIVVLDVEAIAKLAGAFMLVIFGLLNASVIVMRESHIDAYDPQFRSPLYPWTQLAGVAVTVGLISRMGWLSILFTVGLVVGCLLWYWVYARHRAEREGAIYHLFARLGSRRDAQLDEELMGVVQEQELREDDRFDEVVARAVVLDLADDADLRDVISAASPPLARRIHADPDALSEQLLAGEGRAAHLGKGGVAAHVLADDALHPELAIARVATPIPLRGPSDQHVRVEALFFLVGPRRSAGQVFRILAQLASHVGSPEFLSSWRIARTEQELKEILLRDDRFLSLHVGPDGESASLVDHALRDIRFPEGALVALVQRRGHTMIPRGRTVLREGDRLTIVGDPGAIDACVREFGGR